ncbi:ester cyclase [Allorhizocola rhizosphaerae]|uniref:ester cyclase n=1 Tax=Allorhizocola rhizosphaerae TaxID=1872709 RepID=UPI000E3E836A|nr:ester cyclase [Allorhizocola rhizosphaerae]
MNERLIRDLVESVWNGRAWDRLPDFFAATFDHSGRPDTPAGLRAWHESDSQTWSDTHYEIADLIATGDRVALHWRATARHTGHWGPVPPTGRTIAWDGVHFFTVRDSRIVAMWATADMFTKALQLGVTMTPPAR